MRTDVVGPMRLRLWLETEPGVHDADLFVAVRKFRADGTEVRWPINALFDLVEKMRTVDTAGVEPLAQPLASVRAVALRLADDVASAADCRAENQQSAPLVDRGLFLVPRVIE